MSAYCNVSVVQCPSASITAHKLPSLSMVSQQNLHIIPAAHLPMIVVFFPEFAPEAPVSGGTSAGSLFRQTTAVWVAVDA